MSNNNAAKSTKIELQDLQQSVNALLQQIDRACDGIVKRHEATAAATAVANRPAFTPAEIDSDDEFEAADSAKAPASDLGAQVDEMINDAVGAAGAVQESLDHDVEASDEDDAALQDIAEQAESLATEASNAARQDETESDAAATATESVEAIEADVAAAEESASAEAEAETDEAVAVATAEPRIHVEDFDGSNAADDPVDEAEDAAQSEAVVAERDDARGADPAAIQTLDATIEAEAAALEEELDELEGDYESADQVQAAEAPNSRAAAKGKQSDAALDGEFADETGAAAGGARTREPVSASAEIDSPFARRGESAAKAEPKKAVRHTAPSTNGAKSGGNRSPRKKASPPPLRERAVRLVLAPMSRPLAALDPSLRDTIGWVGVNTLFIALCLWLFLLLK